MLVFHYLSLSLWGCSGHQAHSGCSGRSRQRVVPKSRLLTFTTTACNPATAQGEVWMASSSEEAQRSQVTCPWSHSWQGATSIWLSAQALSTADSQDKYRWGAMESRTRVLEWVGLCNRGCYSSKRLYIPSFLASQCSHVRTRWLTRGRQCWVGPSSSLSSQAGAPSSILSESGCEDGSFGSCLGPWGAGLYPKDWGSENSGGLLHKPQTFLHKVKINVYLV